MKKISLFALIFLCHLFVFGQRKTVIRTGVDTSSVTFKEVYHFWQSYQDDLFRKLVLGDSSVNTNQYWADSEIAAYKSPDIILSFSTVYYFLPEYLIGIEKRNDSLYEISSVYFSNYSKNPEILIAFSVFVSKTDAGYKLYNAFTFNKSGYNEKNMGWLRFYYPDNYHFSETDAKQLSDRAQYFAEEWGMANVMPIKYYLFPTYTAMLTALGITIGIDDFVSVDNVRKRGFALSESRHIFYTQHGENLLHEIIHILIYDMRGNMQGRQFDEGVCSYFGEHQGELFPFHAARLKEFLNHNPQIDLGISLVGAYLDENRQYSHDPKWKEEPYGNISWYRDDSTNYYYIIMGTICEIAYKKGGMSLVKNMIIEAENDEKMYEVIEKHLQIKRNEIDQYLRNYLNQNY